MYIIYSLVLEPSGFLGRYVGVPQHIFRGFNEKTKSIEEVAKEPKSVTMHTYESGLLVQTHFPVYNPLGFLVVT